MDAQEVLNIMDDIQALNNGNYGDMWHSLKVVLLRGWVKPSQEVDEPEPKEPEEHLQDEW